MGEHRLSRRAALGLLGGGALAQRTKLPPPRPPVTSDRFLEDLSRRAFLYFWERASPDTGLVLDRALNSDAHDARNVSSSAATGFGLTALCIAASRGWMERDALRRRALAALRFYAQDSEQVHGWFYHFVDASTGKRVWNCELSTIDTALLVAGVLTARQYFDDDEVRALADSIYRRLDWQWFLNGDPHFLSMGWKPESGFLSARWNTHCELGILYLLGIGAPVNPLTPDCWYAWSRPQITYAGHTYISGAPPLFTHQYSQAWIDFREKREQADGRTDWFQNSVEATLAHREFCIDLGLREFPGCYDESLWGITASDSAHGYVAWGGPPRDGPIDGTVVPCAAGGSLMFARNLCLQTLTAMKQRFGSRVWNRYGFVDAFHPTNGWTNPDVIGIDLGVTLLAAENARSGAVWKWFMSNPNVANAMRLAQIA